MRQWIGWTAAAVLVVAGVFGASWAAPTTGEAAKTVLGQAIELVGPAPADTPKAMAMKEGDKLVCIGDSITQAGGYVRMIDAALAQQYPDLKLPKAINVGISGQKAEQLVARFEKDVVARKPAFVTISVGVNDVWHRMNAPHDAKVLAAYKGNVTKMVEMAQKAKIQVILLAPTLIYEDAGNEHNKRLKLYVAALKEIAADKKCQFVDLHQMFLDAMKKKPADVKGNWLTGDGVHMKPLGDAIMAVGVLRALGVEDEKIAASKPAAPPAKGPRRPRG